ncbi:hypothetical protein D9757_002081 [Collybiopsis confluens]|uniref:Exonuclease domain-containing protein n=1 Tax=Collybiopsis confluens TaxID=2823264 RepID=A0A8H5MES9_9AGAR|nr:hypothetical protein D9757_002081 [Collybiopsis confluens]
MVSTWIAIAIPTLLAFLVWSSKHTALIQETLTANVDESGAESKEDSNEANLRQPYDVFLVLDVEGTCQRGSSFDYPNEIIEFPVCLMKWKNDKERRELVVVDEFRSFVKPLWRPNLSKFCEELTGITQSQVDRAPSFPEVLNSVFHFLVKNGVLEEASGEALLRFAWCSDGPYDIRDFVVKTCFISKVTMPKWLRRDVLDVHKLVTDWHITQNFRGRKMKALLAPNHPKRPSLNIASQLRVLGLPAFEGRQHSGIDVGFVFNNPRYMSALLHFLFILQDARNIARIVAECALRDIYLRPNTAINPYRRWNWMAKSGEVVLEPWQSIIAL